VSPRYDLVILDMDGVLVDTSPCHRRAYDILWSHLGIDAPPYETLAGRRTLDVVREHTASLSPRAGDLEEWVRFKQATALELIASEPIVFDDTLPAVRSLAARTSLALATGASRRATELVLDRSGIRPYLDAVVTAEDVNRGKPAPDCYLEAMRMLGVSPDRAVVVEDSASGLDAALGSGAWALSVRTGIGHPDPRFIGRFATLAEVVGHLVTEP